MTTLCWLTAAASLIGVVLNIRRHVACFWIWMATNAIWAVADALHGLPQQAALQAVYVGLAVWGAKTWHRRAPAVPPAG